MGRLWIFSRIANIVIVFTYNKKIRFRIESHAGALENLQAHFRRLENAI